MTEFHKMQGLGNDFVVLDLRNQSFDINPQIATELANRRQGVGCDQILILRSPAQPHQQASFEIWNSDGSQAEQCGNGVRCLGLYLHMRNETVDGKAYLAGPADEIKIQCLDSGLVQVDMGKPDFKPESVPVNAAQVQTGHAQTGQAQGLYQIHTHQGDLEVGAVSMGNPHALLELQDLEHTDISALGAAISRHSAFPAGCNAGFSETINRDEIQLRVFERGAAETMACGSGACAAMVILRKAGKVNETVRVTQAGGVLIISWLGENEPVMMTGPADYVYKGTFI